MGIAIVFFWFSLRTETHELEYSLIALGVWVITFFLDRRLKNEEEKEK